MNGKDKCDRSFSREVHKASAEIGDDGSAIASTDMPQHLGEFQDKVERSDRLFWIQ